MFLFRKKNSMKTYCASKHHDVFSKDKTDLGKANNCKLKIDLKEVNPIYVKQFLMPEVHRNILEGQVKDWLKTEPRWFRGLIEQCSNTALLLISGR